MITLVLADDHTIVRQGLKLVLGSEKDLRIVGETDDGLATVELVAEKRPAVLVLDLSIPRLHGLEVIRQVRRESPETQIVILSMHSDAPYVVEALRYGASAYILKESTAADLVKAIREVQAGRRYLSAALAERTLENGLWKGGDADTACYDTLTPRERLVLQLAAEGHSSTEIGSKLSISPRTVETHRTNLMRKLSLHSQTDLVRFAIRKQIITA